MNDTYSVQFVGGHADGVELILIGMPNEVIFRTADQLPFEYGNWDLRFEYHLETYVRLPDTTIYVLKEIK